MKALVFALLLSLTPVVQLSAQEMIRSVKGTVTDENGKPLKGVIVQLENRRTLQIRSYLTKKDGEYFFHGLRTNIDYQLRAQRGRDRSSTETLSKLDSHKTAVIDLKIDTD